MNFCKFSTEVVATKHTMIDNVFITDFLPSAPDMAVKVYLYGLHKCLSPLITENTLEHFSQVFGISTEDILSIFLYWQDVGIVQVLTTEPFEVRYMPVKHASVSSRKWSESKYDHFNLQIQEVICGRMITPNEYNEYYILLETLKIEPDALVAIASYCVGLKGTTVGHAYITTVTRIWAAEGIKTLEKVKEKLSNSALVAKDASLVLSALGSKRQANVEEQNLFSKWTNAFGYDLNTLVLVAKMLKKQKKSTFEKMDYSLGKFYEAKMFSFQDIEEFESKKEEMFGLAKQINKALGVWYESLDSEVSEFISNWLGLGFKEETLQAIASYCFKKSIRNLEGMHGVVQKFHKLGVISLESLAQYIEDLSKADQIIKHLLETAGANREVNQWDRNLFKIWTQDWHFSEDIIAHACTLANSKAQPMQYASKILASYYEKKITTLEEAKRNSDSFASHTTQNKPNKIVPREYTSAELNALFDNLEEIEI